MRYNSLIEKARKAYEQNNLESALGYYLEAEKIHPDSVWLLITIALIYDELGEIFATKKYYEKVLALDSANPVAYYGLGTIYDNLREYDKAISYYKEASEYAPNYREAHFCLANIYDELHEAHLAIYHYQQAITIDPEYFYAHLNLGSVYETLNQNELALEHFKAAEHINPDNHLLHFNFGVVYRKLGKIPESIKSYERVIKLSPDYANAYLNLALIYKDIYQDLDEAIKVYSSGLEVCRDNAVLLYNRGCCYALQNKTELALEDITNAVKLDKGLHEYALQDEELVVLRKYLLR